MGVNINGFDSEKVDANRGIPGGEYQVVITDSRLKGAKSNPEKNKYIEMDLNIVAGEHSGKTFRDRINLWNENPQAVEIANNKMATICNVFGIRKPTDTEVFHNRQLTAVVKIKDYEGKPSVEVKTYKPKQTGVVPPVTVTATGEPTAASGKPNPFGI